MCSTSKTNSNTCNPNKKIRFDDDGSESKTKIEENSQETKHKLLLTNLYNSRDDDKAETIVLQCKDGQVRAHKCVLVAGSDYFRAIFNRGSIESKENMISLLDTSTSVIDIIIKCVYAQDIPIQPDIPDSVVWELIMTADKMQLKELFDKYWTLHCNPITLDTFLKVWQMAEMLNQDETINTVQTFVLMNLKRISETDKLSDITLTQLESLIFKVKPNKFEKFVIFLLDWEVRTRDRRENNNNTDVVMDLLSNCGVKKLPNYSLFKLLSNETVINSASLYNALSKEATSRWLTGSARQIRIFAFEVDWELCDHSVSLLSDDGWKTCSGGPHLLDDESPVDIFPTVSGTGHLFYFITCKSTDKLYVMGGEKCLGMEETTVISDKKTSETANCNEVFFQQSNGKYLSFNFELGTWRTVNFGDRIADCKRMLLATAESYFFDVDELRMKIVDRRSWSCSTREKLPGRWQSVKCKSLSSISAEKLIFYQKCPDSCLLIYDIEYGVWSVVSAPNITGDLILYVSYDDDCLIFEKTNNSFNIYSLETMKVVKEYAIKENFVGFIHFDASFKA